MKFEAFKAEIQGTDHVSECIELISKGIKMSRLMQNKRLQILALGTQSDVFIKPTTIQLNVLITHWINKQQPAVLVS